MESNNRYLVVIPAYNEEETIEQMVLMGRQYADVCVIDDCSTDATPDILGKFDDIHVIHHEINTHIPGALLDGMKYAIEQDYDYIISIDAGLSHDPNEIPLFINRTHADLVIGVRTKKTNTPLYRRFLSIVGNISFNCCLDFPRSAFRFSQFRDLTSGYRRYSKEAMNLILNHGIQSQSADIFFETTRLIYRNGMTIAEVPISYNFSNSYFKPKIVIDCLKRCLNSVIRPDA